MTTVTEMEASSVLDRLGVRRVVNAYGSATILGGSVLDERIVRAMEEVSHSFVDMDELLDRASKRISDLLNVESAFITSGAAAGLALSAAACMTGLDESKIERLPDIEGLEKFEVVVQNGQRNTYDRCLRVSGARLVGAGIPYLTYPWELEYALSPRTAAVAHFTIGTARPGLLSFDQVAEIARKHSVPIILDGCNDVLPTLKSVNESLKRGADLMVLSGGKNIQGPNDSGIVCGREDLVLACRANCAPHMHGIGRTMKVSKEQITGLVVALEVYSQIDPQERYATWSERLDYIDEELRGVSGISINRSPQTRDLTKVPHLEISLDEQSLGFSAKDVVNAMKAYDPPIVLDIDYWKNFTTKTVFVNPSCMQGKDEEVVAKALKSVLSNKSVMKELLSKQSRVRACAYP